MMSAPPISELKYRDLVDESLARIPVHNPEWTNFNDSDPGVTLIQLFSFLTENLIYRTNRIPDNSRRKFLSLLGIPLQPGTSARGLVTFSQSQPVVSTLRADQELRAGEIPFRTELGLDVLPVDWKIYYRKTVPADEAAEAIYRQLYASFGREGELSRIHLYETTPFPAVTSLNASGGIDLRADTIDGSVWIALLRRPNELDEPDSTVLARLAGKTVSLGVIPAQVDARSALSPAIPAAFQRDPLALLRFEIPAGGLLSSSGEMREPSYAPLYASATTNPAEVPTVVQLTLPNPMPGLWSDVEPTEEGIGNMPPSLEDTADQMRLITWIRMRLKSSASDADAGQGRVKLLWLAPNTTSIVQRTRVTRERLTAGTGEPGQRVALAHRPVIAGSVQLAVTPARGGDEERWGEIDDILAAGSELEDPGGIAVTSRTAAPANVFQLNAEAGELWFGDGTRGRRPPYNAQLVVSYDYGFGRAGNVAPQAITTGAGLPPGLTVSNQVATWGGADPETTADGERQIARFIQHRDRLVTTEDFDTIVRRTPGVDLGRVEVLPAFHPDLSGSEPGDVPGVVTVMVIPGADPLNPDAPMPNRMLLSAICDHLDPRRLVTTEIHVRGPIYKGIWLSVAVRATPGASIAVVREAVRARLLAFLSPLPAIGSYGSGGWPLRSPVLRLQLLAEASRVPGVLLIEQIEIARESNQITPVEQIEFVGLELPRVLGISMEGIPVAELRRQMTGGLTLPTIPDVSILSIPVIPDECR